MDFNMSLHEFISIFMQSFCPLSPFLYPWGQALIPTCGHKKVDKVGSLPNMNKYKERM